MVGEARSSPILLLLSPLRLPVLSAARSPVWAGVAGVDPGPSTVKSMSTATSLLLLPLVARGNSSPKRVLPGAAAGWKTSAVASEVLPPCVAVKVVPKHREEQGMLVLLVVLEMFRP